MRKKLEFQADRIEAVLALNKVSARVTGGTVTPRWVRFQVLPAVGAKISKIKRLNEEMAAALDAPSCRVSRRGAAVAVEVPRDDPQPVRLLPLYRQLNDEDGRGIPPVTAILGLAEDGAPLLIRLPSPDVAHILVAGTTGSGKTVLLQTMILSLAMANSPAGVQGLPGSGDSRRGRIALVLIDPKGHAFRPFEALSHLARPVIRDVAEMTEALQSLVRLMERPRERSRSGVRPPSVVVFIDELADLLMVGGKPVQHALTRLTQRGREAGIHIVAATQKPTTAVLGSLVKANFPVRLVGRVTSIEDARTATGWSGTGAERLMGRGDFLAVAEGRVVRFQTAHVSPEDIREMVAYLMQGEVMLTGLSVDLPMERPFLPWPTRRLTEVLRGGRRNE
jgi:S-DNA-T family DNA segregation ATPase FtsK/SpoIIIE